MLKGKRILVTGASSGIGRAVAVKLSREGAKVHIAGRHQERLQETFEALDGEGHGRSHFDLSDYSKIDGWMEDIWDDGFSGFVHAAGCQMTCPVRNLQSESYERIVSINVMSGLALASACARRSENIKHGSLVFISAAAALAGSPALSVYAATKGAIISMVRSMALEFSEMGMRVNAIAPALLRSEMFDEIARQLTPEQFSAMEREYPLGFGLPEDVANAAAYLSSDLSHWVTGTTLLVDGGVTAH